MSDFQNDKERLDTLKKTFPDIYEKYPKTVTQQQAAEICRVDIQTIRHWEKSGDVPFVPAVNKLIHYHQIRLDDLLTCLYIKNCLHESGSLYMKTLRQYYIRKFIDFPDALLIRDIVAMTGYVKTTAVYWMNLGYLKGYNRGRTYRIPKKYMIDFVCGTYYRQIKRKSDVHKADMQSFLEELKKT
jgi:DNA-binding XRE family transcriptional regulator